jgi:hypothetical protein
VRVVQTLVVRDEADIVDAQITYHLKAGVDFVLATDHDSRDGTAEILASYEREGHLRLFREKGEMRDSQWRTQMARLAVTEHGADWVVNTDADEFWMPRRGTLKEMLAAIPETFGVIWALTRHFVPRPIGDPAFAERMTARLSATTPLNDPTSPYRPHAKVAHRGDAGVVVFYGSHDVGSSFAPLREWYPADVLHFPFRSREQWERKGVRRARHDKRLGQYVRAQGAAESGQSEDFYGSLVVDDAALERGLKNGSLVVDTRLRERLRSSRATPSGGSSADGVEDCLRAGAEAAALRDANLVRAARRLDELSARLGQLERRRWARPARRRAPSDRGHP